MQSHNIISGREMYDRVRAFVQEYSMLGKSDRVIAGVSGGADSVCLLFMLLKLRREIGFDLRVVHVNHGLRGEAADRDEAYVRKLCEEQGVAISVFREDVAAVARERSLTLEEAGREVRRGCMQRALAACEGTRIALAHHRDDNAETLLWNLCRGTNLRGLAGILPKNGVWIRPLLCLNRKEIESYLEKMGISYCTDATNLEDDYTRNRIRNHVIPYLEEHVNAQSARHIAAGAERLSKLWEYVDSEIGRYESSCAEYQAEYQMDEGHGQCESVCAESSIDGESERDKSGCAGSSIDGESERYKSGCTESGIDGENGRYESGCAGFSIDRENGRYENSFSEYSRNREGGQRVLLKKEAFDQVPEALKSYVIHRILCRAAGHSRDIEETHVRAVQELLDRQAGRSLDLPYGVRARRCYEGVRFEKQSEEAAPVPDGEPPEGLFRCRIFENSPDLGSFPENTYTKWFDYDIIKNTVKFRHRKAGDYIVINRSGGKQKLKQYFVNEKIPRELRDSVWLAADGSEIMWIVGCRQSQAYQVTEQTEHILEIAFYGGEKDGRDNSSDDPGRGCSSKDQRNGREDQ